MSLTTLIDAGGIKARFDIDPDSYPDPRITPSTRSASKRLRELVGNTMYDAALANAVLLATDPPGDVADANAAILYELQNAEAHFAMYYATVGFNSPVSSKGVMKEARSSDPPERRIYLSPTEITQLAQAYLDEATDIVRRLLGGVPSDAQIVATTPHHHRHYPYSPCSPCGGYFEEWRVIY